MYAFVCVYVGEVHLENDERRSDPTAVRRRVCSETKIVLWKKKDRECVVRHLE